MKVANSAINYINFVVSVGGLYLVNCETNLSQATYITSTS